LATETQKPISYYLSFNSSSIVFINENGDGKVFIKPVMTFPIEKRIHTEAVYLRNGNLLKSRDRYQELSIEGFIQQNQLVEAASIPGAGKMWK